MRVMARLSNTVREFPDCLGVVIVPEFKSSQLLLLHCLRNVKSPEVYHSILRLQNC